jgi:hypothetical protein
MKKTLTQFVLFAYLVAPSAVHAKCIERPNYRARVTVMSCVAATFAASDVSIALFPGEKVPNYEKGAKIFGTFLAIEVISSSLEWGENSYRDAEFKPWSKGALRSIFVAKPPAETCPSHMPSEIAILTKFECCDTAPEKGLCLVPKSVDLATVVERNK